MDIVFNVGISVFAWISRLSSFGLVFFLVRLDLPVPRASFV